MKYKLAKTVLIVCILVFILIGPISNFVGIDLKALKEQYPGFPFLFNGMCLIVVGILNIMFRNEFGIWAASYRKRLADKYPAWKKMSGLPEDKVEYYLSVEFNRKMVILGAVILIVAGASLVVIGVLIKG